MGKETGTWSTSNSLGSALVLLSVDNSLIFKFFGYMEEVLLVEFLHVEQQVHNLALNLFVLLLS